jgi:hypothetical protein
MKSVSRLALGATLAIGATSALFTAPADAQRAPRGKAQQNQAGAQAQAQGPALNLNAQERAALLALQTAAAGTDRAAQDAAIAAARPVATGGDARYAFSGLLFRIGRQRTDSALLLESLPGLVDSPRTSAADLPGYLRVQYELARNAGQRDVADRALARLAQLEPNNPETQVALAQSRVTQGRVAEGLRAIQAAIQTRQAAGQPAPEAWHRFGVATAYNSQDAAVRALAPAFARGLVTAYPTAVNWRDALTVVREGSTFDAAAQLDLYRLMLATGALSGERDYFDFANALNSGGYPAEAKAVLDQGISRGAIDRAKPAFSQLLSTASGRIAADRADLTSSQRSALAAATGTPALRTGDAFFGYGRYPEAIALYQAALQKGGVDANVVNTRLGIAHALAGQRPQAEAALRAVTGPRSEIAAYWLIWLQQRPAA